MAEYPMEPGSNLPLIHQELIHVARHEERSNPLLAEMLAKALAQRNTHLWDDLNLQATKAAEGDPVTREKIMHVGVHVVGLIDRAQSVAGLERSLDAEVIELPAPAERAGKKRVRTWLAGHVALLGFGFSALKKPKAGDVSLG